MAARQGLRRHRGDHDRRLRAVTLTVTARVLDARMLQHRHLDRHVQLLAEFLAHPVHRFATARADLLIIGQIVFDTLARKIRRQRFAATLAGFWLTELRQPGVRQSGRVEVALVNRIPFSDFFSLIEHAVLALLALRRVLSGQRKAILLFERIEALSQFVDLGVAFCETGFEFVDVGLGGPRQSREFRGFHALHDNEAQHRAGLRRFVTAGPAVVGVLPSGMTAHRVDIDAI
jgi:hypothetical protein